MKKIFGISLVAIFAISPMMAGAEVVAGDPGATTSGAPTASASPKYELKNAVPATDGNAATAGYVKGAYNAIIKGINKTQDEIDTINTNIGTYSNTVEHLLDNTATQTGTVATVNAATTSESIATSSVNITGVTTSSLSATASGDVNLSMRPMTEWVTPNSNATMYGFNENLAVSPTLINVVGSFSGLTVNDLSMNRPTKNTATLTKTGIAGTVSVARYRAYDYTPLININGDTVGSENGEWFVTWNSYGTAKGTSACSGSNGVRVGATTSTISSPFGAKKYCWCKMTGFTDNNNTTYNESSLWVFNTNLSQAAICDSNCLDSCSSTIQTTSAMRSGMFGSIQ